MRINGHDLYVESAGPASGPVVVLLHHGLGSTLAWQSQIPVLVEAGYRVVVYDRWGYGGSQARIRLAVPAFDADMRDLIGMLDALKIERATLVGHSDGGTIALYAAAGWQQRITSLVVVAAHIYLDTQMAAGLQSVAQAYQQNAKFRDGLQRAHGEKAGQVFRNWFDGWLALARCPERQVWDMRLLVASISCPTLVVQGVEDEYATPRQAEELADAIPGAELWLADGAGHMLPQEQAEAFNRRMLVFLEQHHRVKL